MPVDYDALRGDGSVNTPDDGEHIALLERAALVETGKGDNVVTEWKAPSEKASWQSWNRFDPSGMPYTRDLLVALGVNLSTLTDDDGLQAELDKCVNRYWRVNTTSRMGNQGDRVFITTYVNGPTGPPQPDVPIDSEGLPDAPPLPVPAAGSQFGDKSPF